MLSPIPQMRRISTLVETHQESWNGNGYPLKRKGEAIPRLTRVISIAHAYHAMVSTRLYRKGMTIENARGILTDRAGKQWDPRFVERFVKMVTPDEDEGWARADPEEDASRGRSSVGRAPALQAGCLEFESPRLQVSKARRRGFFSFLSSPVSTIAAFLSPAACGEGRSRSHSLASPIDRYDDD